VLPGIVSSVIGSRKTCRVGGRDAGAVITATETDTDAFRDLGKLLK
jgi:hypothetical protein